MNKIYKVVWNTVRNCYVVGSELISSKSGRHSTSNGKSSSLKVTLTVLALCGMTALGSGLLPAYAADAGTARESQYVAVLVADKNSVPYGDKITFDGYSYHKETVSGETYWVRDGYTIKYEKNERYPGARNANIIKAYKTSSYTADSDAGLLKSNQIMVKSSNVSTLTDVILDDVSGGTYVGATNSGNTTTPSSFNYMIKDDNGQYVDAGNTNFSTRFKAATLNKDGTYSYNGEVISNDNLYVVDNTVGVFLTSNKNVYTGKVFGANNEVLVTTKGEDGKMYSYWGADTPDPNTKLADMTIGQFNQALEKVNNNSKAVAGDVIKDIRTTSKENGGTIDLVRRGTYNSATGKYEGDDYTVGSGITVTSLGGTEGKDVKIHFSAGDNGFDVAAGSKVEAAKATEDATDITALKINGQTYNIKTGIDSYVTDATLNGNTLTLNRNQGLESLTVDLSSLTKGFQKAVNVVSGTNTTVEPSTKTDEIVEYKVNLNKDVTLGAASEGNGGTLTVNASNGNQVLLDGSTISVKTNGQRQVVLAGNGLAITNGPSITTEGIDAGSKQIHNVGSGLDGKTYDTTVSGRENWNNAASIGDVHTIARDEAGKAAEAVKAKSGKNITVDADNKVNLNDDITLGTDFSKQVKVDGTNGRVVIGSGDTAVTLGQQSNTSGDSNPTEGNYLTGLDNTNWDASHIQSGRAATEDQLYQVASSISTVDKHHTEVTVNGATAPSSAGTYTDGNLQIAQKTGTDGQKIYDLKLSNNLDLGDKGSVQMGNTTVNNGGVTITHTDADGNSNNVSLTENGLSNGGNKITKIAAGDVSSTSTDAVNGSQLYEVKTMAGQHTTVKAGSDNVSVTEGTNDAGGKEYTVDLAKDVTFGSDANQIAINGTNGTVTVGTGNNQVKLDGSDGSVTAGGVTINNGGNGKIDGLTNTTWDGNNYTTGQAATEDQLHQVESNINKAISTVDQHHTEVTVNGGTAPASDGKYTDGNLQIAQSTGRNGQKIYDLKLSDNLSIGGAGKDGQDGTDGHMDIKGSDGTSGVSLDGKDGISIKGSDGNSSVTISGKEGVDGVNGAEGHIGLNGKDGVTDIWTTAGTPGLNGKDGETMTRVVYQNPNGGTHEAATLDDGMKYSGDSGTAAVTLNNNVQIYGGATEYADGNNIGVVASQDGDNAKLQIKLAKDLTGINSIEATTITSDTFQSGNTTINNNGLTIKTSDADRTISIADGNVNMGGNTVSGVADGQVAPGSTDAVNGSQLYATNQRVTANTESISTLNQTVNNNTESINVLTDAVVTNAENINSLSHSLNKLDSRINRVGAGAAALAALHPLDFDPDNKWDFAAGYGNYAGANAIAIGTYYRPNENTMFSIGGSFGGGENMINAGVSFKLGSGGSGITTSKTVMAKKIKEQDELLKAQDAKMKEQDEKIAKLEAFVAQQGEMIQQALGKK